jgi:hypothetical protein
MSMTYEDARQLIALDGVVDPRPALHRAMLAELGAAEARGEEPPGWEELEYLAEDRLHAAGGIAPDPKPPPTPATIVTTTTVVHWSIPALVFGLAWIAWMTRKVGWS